jgi:hypothetical protein
MTVPASNNFPQVLRTPVFIRNSCTAKHGCTTSTSPWRLFSRLTLCSTGHVLQVPFYMADRAISTTGDDELATSASALREQYRLRSLGQIGGAQLADQASLGRPNPGREDHTDVFLIANPRLEPRLSLRKQTTQKFLIANLRRFLFCRFSSNFHSVFSALSSRMASETTAIGVLYSMPGIR